MIGRQRRRRRCACRQRKKNYGGFDFIRILIWFHLILSIKIKISSTITTTNKRRNACLKFSTRHVWVAARRRRRNESCVLFAHKICQFSHPKLNKKKKHYFAICVCVYLLSSQRMKKKINRGNWRISPNAHSPVCVVCIFINGKKMLINNNKCWLYIFISNINHTTTSIYAYFTLWWFRAAAAHVFAAV